MRKLCCQLQDKGPFTEAQKISWSFQQGEHQCNIWDPEPGQPAAFQVWRLCHCLQDPRTLGQASEEQNAHHEAGVYREAAHWDVRRDGETRD